MSYQKRIERIEKRTPQQQAVTVEELLDRLGMGSLKKDVARADSFLDIVTDQGERVVWRK
jgi:hypothetical protein